MHLCNLFTITFIGSIIVGTVEQLFAARVRPKSFCCHSRVQNRCEFAQIALIHSVNRKMYRCVMPDLGSSATTTLLSLLYKIIIHEITLQMPQTRTLSDERANNNTTAGSSGEEDSDDEEDHKETHDEVCYRAQTFHIQ